MTRDNGIKSNQLSRRQVLRCAAWGGAGVIWGLKGGMPRAFNIFDSASAADANFDFSFIQISDSHIGFNKEANPDPNGTLSAAIERIRALPTKPAFMLHTGDVSH